MASVPAGGMISKGFGKPNAAHGGLHFYGLKELEEALVETVAAMPLAMKACLTELGLFGEKETKERTPVQYGVLRASIGHFEPSLIQPADPNDPNPTKADPTAAVFDVDEGNNDSYSVTWGTNVEYAAWVEWGFTHPGGFNVYISGVGWRRTRPFSYRGAHMFELGLEATAKVAVNIIEHWAGVAMAKGGMIESKGGVTQGDIAALRAKRSSAAKKGWQTRKGS